MKSRVCITVSNSPNPSRVYVRLCKHGKRFLLLNSTLKSFGVKGAALASFSQAITPSKTLSTEREMDFFASI